MSSFDIKTKKIDVKYARPNMILAKDAINKDGLIIIAKNTMLSDVNYKNLEKNGIKYITIFSKTDIFNEDIKKQNALYEKIEDRKEFQEFQAKHEIKLEKLENQFIAIGEGVGTEIENLYSMVIDMLAGVNCKNDVFSYLAHLKKQDIHTYSHCLNVGIISNLFGLWLGLEGETLKNLTIAGVMHDIGKTQVDINLIKKPGKLTPSEYENVKKHTTLGYDLVKNLDIPEEIKSGILMHHEKIDGSGYPSGLTEDTITLTAKIIAICDIYEAMTADRVYRPRVCPFEVIKNFQQNSYDILDTTLLLAFLQNIAYTYLGTHVILSNNQEGEVVFINQSDLSKPIIRTKDGFIDLSQQSDITIKHII